jgi:hypothetical protein
MSDTPGHHDFSGGSNEYPGGEWVVPNGREKI